MTSKIAANHATPILSISVLSSLLDVHQRTLRIYDKEGILCPLRTDKNRRLYSLDNVEKCRLILFLTRNLGINLSGVKIIFSMLEGSNIKSKDYIAYLNKIAKLVNINLEIQQNNILKNSKKGRKKKYNFS